MSSNIRKNLGFIEHRVSKYDTLAGVAIKYGVEISDIRRMNGLVTDQQMFALKTIQIPLPGRHPPSSCLSNHLETAGECSYGQSQRRRVHNDLFDSFPSLQLKATQQNVSPAMSSLQCYYGLKFPNKETGSSSKPCHRKSRSLNKISDGGESGDVEDGNSEKWNEKLVRRRAKFEAESVSRTPKKMLKEDNSSSTFSATKGKGLALRSKVAGRSNMSTDMENPIAIGRGDSLMIDTAVGVRKSISTPSLQDQESCNSLSLWPTTTWSLKPDLQALSSAVIAKPIFDGFSRPLNSRRNKAALD